VASIASICTKLTIAQRHYLVIYTKHRQNRSRNIASTWRHSLMPFKYSMTLNEPIFRKGLWYQISWKFDEQFSRWLYVMDRCAWSLGKVCVSSILSHKTPFIHSFHWHAQNTTIPCCSQDLLPFLSVIYPFLAFPPVSLTSSLTSSCHLFLSLPLSLVVYKCIYNNFWEFCFLPFSVHAQTNVIYLTILSLSQWGF
jgi:hypothetical protein